VRSKGRQVVLYDRDRWAAGNTLPPALGSASSSTLVAGNESHARLNYPTKPCDDCAHKQGSRILPVPCLIDNDNGIVRDPRTRKGYEPDHEALGRQGVE